MSKRQLPPPSQLRKEDILDQYANTFEGLGQLGPPVHFQVDESTTCADASSQNTSSKARARKTSLGLLH